MSPSNFQQKTLWSALTGIAIVVLGTILVGIIWLSGQVFAYLQPVLVPLAVAGIIAYLLEPVVVFLERKLKVRRLLAVMIVLGGTLLLTATAGTYIGIKIGSQVNELASDRENLGSMFIDKLQRLQDSIGARSLVDSLIEYRDPETGEWIEKPYPAKETKEIDGEATSVWVNRKGEILTEADGVFDSEDGSLPVTPAEVSQFEVYEEQIRELERGDEVSFSDRRIGILLQDNWRTLTDTGLNWLKASTKVFGFVGYLLGFALVPVYLFYFLNESAKIKKNWTQYIPLKASRFKEEVVATVSEINAYLISFFRGQVLVSLIDGILVGVTLSVFRLPYGFLIGIALAVLGIIPFIGNIICMIPAVFIAFTHFGGVDANHQWLGENPWSYAAAVVGIFIVVQNINSLLTAPKIVGDSVGLHPMTVIFSIIFWSLLLGGFLGALLAVPLTAAVKVLFRRYLWEPRVSPQLPSAAAIAAKESYQSDSAE
ncbi:MAG: AI-2E family transporter [Verrucomicrobiota bacterium JB023]|nr:AI-2E family transporter [Verrucomicrobiota bacterium JB023]